jgi:hypothetical protein
MKPGVLLLVPDWLVTNAFAESYRAQVLLAF